MIDTVIFDLDGTLLDTLDDLTGTTNYIQEKNQMPLHTREQVRSHVGNGIPNLVALSIPGGREHPDYEKILEEFRAHYAIHCNDMTQPYPGILELVAALKEKGYKMAIVSNKADSAVKDLNKIYFSQFISIAIGENEKAGIRKKPAPDTVFQALKELGSDAEHAVYVGDSEVDIATAKNSGMPCILCEWGFREKEDLIRQGGSNFVAQAMEIIDLI